MRLPRMTAERAIGPAGGTYATRPGPGHPPAPGALAPMKGRLMRNTDATTADRMLAKMTNVGPQLCGPAQSLCWGTGAHEYDYICCDAGEHCAPGPDGTPDCAPGPAPGYGNIQLPPGYQGITG